VLIGGAGADALIGGDGIDTASYATAAGGVDARLAGGQGGDAMGDTYSGIENLVGSAFADVLLGDDQANRLSGGAGNDILVDFGGSDVLIGGLGADLLVGGTGNDVLVGGAGGDVLRGGLGADVFDFNSVAESMPGKRDMLQGYEGLPSFDRAGLVGGDVIDLAGIDANTTLAGNQAFVFGGSGVGKLSVVDSGANTLIRCNIDNDAAFEFELLIEDGEILASVYRAGDFVL
jgi:Ca2+-binding RTX toxin-like protein